MIWDDTLKKITYNTALDLASKWFDKPENLILINNQINCVYKFDYANVSYFIKISHECIRPVDELTAALHFLEHLKNNKVPVCYPVASKNNKYIEHIGQGNLKFYAHVLNSISGKEMCLDVDDLNVYKNWGLSLAKIHIASCSYKPQGHHFKDWKNLWKETHCYLKNENHEIKDAFYFVDAFFSKLSATDKNYGLTHGDHRPGNVIYDYCKVSIIDFDEPVYHWYLADIAKPFLDLCDKPFEQWRDKFNAYIYGYKTILSLSDEDITNLTWFTRMKSLNIYLWCKNNWFEETAPGGKPREQWLAELRHMALNPMRFG